MKDKELREFLYKSGFVSNTKRYITSNMAYSIRKILDGEYLEYTKRDITGLKRDITGLKKENEDLNNKLNALMELLCVKEIPAESHAKLKKGNKEVSLGPKK